jgi:hypothetical protein
VITGETTSRLRWIYEVAYHAGYLHASEDHELIRRAGTLCDAAERTDTEIIADWCRALDALFAHGVEDALPPGADPAPLDFAGIGNYPLLKLLEQHGTATAEVLSAEIGERATEVAELNRRAGHDAQHDPLPGLEPLECDAVVMASPAIVAGPRVELCVNGDDDQAIYQWSGSDARTIVEFASRYPGAHVQDHSEPA